MERIPAMKELYNSKTGATSYVVGNGEIFVDFNRYLKPFIKVNIYPDKFKRFDFTKRGYDMAIDYLKSNVGYDK